MIVAEHGERVDRAVDVIADPKLPEGEREVGTPGRERRGVEIECDGDVVLDVEVAEGGGIDGLNSSERIDVAAGDGGVRRGHGREKSAEVKTIKDERLIP